MNLSSEVSAMFNSPMPSLNIRSLPVVVFLGGFPSRCQNLSSGAIRPGGLLLNICIQNGRQRPFCFPIDAKIHRVLVIWDLSGYCEYEFDRYICDKVMTCTSVGVRRRRRRRRPHNQKHIITEIFQFRGYNYTQTVLRFHSRFNCSTCI